MCQRRALYVSFKELGWQVINNEPRNVVEAIVVRPCACRLVWILKRFDKIAPLLVDLASALPSIRVFWLKATMRIKIGSFPLNLLTDLNHKADFCFRLGTSTPGDLAQVSLISHGQFLFGLSCGRKLLNISFAEMTLVTYQAWVERLLFQVARCLALDWFVNMTQIA